MWMVLLHVLLVSGFTLRILLREDLAPALDKRDGEKMKTYISFNYIF